MIKTKTKTTNNIIVQCTIVLNRKNNTYKKKIQLEQTSKANVTWMAFLYMYQYI